MVDSTKYSLLAFVGSVLLLYFVVRPVFTPYLLGTADGFAHKYRLVNFDRALSQGTLRPRWIGDAALGFGAPLYIFNYSVPYYIVDAIYRLGFTIQTSAQIFAAATLIAAFFTMYLFISRLWGRWAGIVSAAVYTFGPYHLHVTYSYEAWGEMLAFAFPPLILWLLYGALRSSPVHRLVKLFWYAGTILTWVLFILTHNISSFMMSPVILLLAFLLSKRNSASLIYLARIAILVVLISGFFLLPAVALTDTIKIPELMTKEFALRSLYMSSLVQQIRLSYAALFGKHILYQVFTVGVPILGVAFLGLFAIIFPQKNNLRAIGLAFLGLLALALFLDNPISNIFYIFLPLRYVLYPYRFLFLATFSGSALAGYLFRKSTIAGLCIIILACIFGYPFTHPYLEIFPFPVSYFSQPQMLNVAVPTLKNMGTEEFLPATADVKFLNEEEQKYLTTGILPKKFILPADSGTISAQTIRQESLSAAVHTTRNVTLTVSTLYYPGWRATIDGKSVPVSHDQYGRITVSVPVGVHAVKLYFGFSAIEIAGIAISLIGIVFFVITLLI